jgi:hypothetical protein
MTPKVFALLQSACEGKAPEDFVLTRDNGRPVRDFRESWRNLCVAARLGRFVCRECGKEAELKYEAGYECPKCKTARRRDLRYEGRIVHDMRRSAAKALRRAGVPESLIMATGGWKTAAMFRRYAIVSSSDQRDAMEMLERARAERQLASVPPQTEGKQPN